MSGPGPLAQAGTIDSRTSTAYHTAAEYTFLLLTESGSMHRANPPLLAYPGPLEVQD